MSTNIQEDRPLRYRTNLEQIAPEMEALYGREVVQAELAARANVYGLDLRANDEPASQDPWEQARRAASIRGGDFDPAATAGLRCGFSLLGDADQRQQQRWEQAQAIKRQRFQWAVAIGATVTLRNGKALSGGDEITVALIDHQHAVEVIQALITRGIVTEIDPHTVFLRGLDPSIGPYVAVRDVVGKDNTIIRRGQGCSEQSFAQLVEARTFADADPIATMTCGELRRLIADVIYMRVPGAPREPTPISAYHRALDSNAVQGAPNYVAPTAKGKSK